MGVNNQRCTAREWAGRPAARAAAVANLASVLIRLIPSFLHLSLSDGIRTVWAGANIVFVLLGLILSVICVRNRESRSVINIVSTAISAFWLLLMVGIVALALFLTFVQ